MHALESMVGTSAILPSPNRIRSKMSDKKHHGNYRDLHVNLPQTIPIPRRGRQGVVAGGPAAPTQSVSKARLRQRVLMGTLEGVTEVWQGVRQPIESQAPCWSRARLALVASGPCQWLILRWSSFHNFASGLPSGRPC